jgi:prophage regulatory protein
MNSLQPTQTQTGYLRQWQIIGNRKRGIPAPMLEISSATLWRWVNAGKFPKPYKLSGVTAWSAAEVQGWMAAQAAK